MISIYTDASIKKRQLARGCCIVLTDSNYMGFTEFTIGNATPQVAEIQTCLHSIEYAQKLCPDMSNDEVVLYCDNETVVDAVNNRNFDGVIKEWIDPLRDSLDRNKVTIKYIEGHSVGTNPNTVVDRILRAHRR